MNEKVQKLINLVNDNSNLEVTLKGYGTCEIIGLSDDDEGITISYEDDLGGYGNYETVEEEISWEDLFKSDFQIHKVTTERELIEI